MYCKKCQADHPAWAMSVDVDLCKDHYYEQKRTELDKEVAHWDNLKSKMGPYTPIKRDTAVSRGELSKKNSAKSRGTRL